ncbi:MAG: DDE-type integrase/transposase/recombinase [Aphanocapsa sp. GSE-SYN-MK-11-07L]|nr:DDE-type integrase/transposase/recombinase [Aphanocapsa sp. GSE-SYN-MK-11-07L]
MKKWYSASELSGLPGLPSLSNNIARKAKAEKWSSQPRSARGGGKEYALESLPKQTQAALVQQRGNDAVNNLRVATFSSVTPSLPLERRVSPNVKTTIAQRTDAWLEILKAYEVWHYSQRDSTAVERDISFVRAYNQQQIPLPDWVYAYLPCLSRSRLKAKQILRRQAPKITALGGNYGSRKGTGTINSDPHLQTAIKACLAAGGKHWGSSQIYDVLQLEFGLDPEHCSIGQLRDWLRTFRSTQPQEWALYMAPDRAKGLHSPAFGSRSQAVFRPNQVWEIDTMHVDIDCKYEQGGLSHLDRSFIVTVIDVFSRRAMLHVAERSNAEAVCLLIATAILKWGVPEQICTDHGKEYLSRRVQRFLANLGIETEDLRCLPGHPEQKPFVERFNRTFQHRDLVKSPFFVGHNVGDRQTLRVSPGRDRPGIELAMSMQSFQDWCDQWCASYEQRPHGRAGIGLGGKSPQQVLVEAVREGWIQRTIYNPRELDFLMMAAPGKEGTRKVGRQGISVGGRLYVAAELATWIGRSVYVCFNPRQPGTVYVYRNSQLIDFICPAIWREADTLDLAEVANRARHLYDILLRSVNQTQKRGKALLHKLASDPYVLVHKTAQELVQTHPNEIHNYPAIQAITAAIATTQPPSNPELLTVDLDRFHQELQRLEEISQNQAALEEQQRSLRLHLESLVSHWQQRHPSPALEPPELESLQHYLASSNGQGFLAALTTSLAEERQFCQWLTQETIPQLPIMNCRASLEVALMQWREQRAISFEERQSLQLYLQEPEGLGILKAYTNPLEESQFKAWLLHPSSPVT